MSRLQVIGWLGKKRFHVGLFLYLSSEQSQTTVQIWAQNIFVHIMMWGMSFHFKSVSPELNRQANNNKIRVPLNVVLTFP